MINIPYVKEYNAYGICTNPLTQVYKSPHPNRRQRREKIRLKMNNRSRYNDRDIISRLVFVQEIRNKLGRLINVIKHKMA